MRALIILAATQLMIELLCWLRLRTLVRSRKKRKKRTGIDYVYFARTCKQHLNHRYRFRIIKVAGQYRCYVICQPSYRDRRPLEMPHCWIDTSNRRYICWTGKIENDVQAKTLCRMWADITQRYIDTGINDFPEG